MRILSVLCLVLGVCFGLIGCKTMSNPLVDLRSAGVDIFASSNTIKGIESSPVSISVLEKYDTPVVVIEEVIGVKSYPNANYSKTVKKYNNDKLVSISEENIHPIEKVKSSNLPLFIIAGVFIFGIICNLIIKMVKK